MKSIKTMLLSGSLLLAAFSYAQTESNNHGTNKNKVSKGYYSIYRNNEKLKPSKAIRLTTKGQVDTNISSGNLPVGKGYYSISSNKDRNRSKGISLSGDGIEQGVIQPSTPVVTKGYYSIGNNNRKLRN